MKKWLRLGSWRKSRNARTREFLKVPKPQRQRNVLRLSWVKPARNGKKQSTRRWKRTGLQGTHIHVSPPLYLSVWMRQNGPSGWDANMEFRRKGDKKRECMGVAVGNWSTPLSVTYLLIYHFFPFLWSSNFISCFQFFNWVIVLRCFQSLRKRQNTRLAIDNFQGVYKYGRHLNFNAFSTVLMSSISNCLLIRLDFALKLNIFFL